MQAIRKVSWIRLPASRRRWTGPCSMMALHQDHLDAETVRETLGAIIKDRDDVAKMSGKSVDAILDGVDARTQEELEQWIQASTQRIEKEFAGR